MNARPAFTLVYDGECRMCRRLVAAVPALDAHRQVTVVASQAPGVRERFHWIPPAAFEAAIQFIAEDGETWAGARAVEAMLDVLPRGRWIAWVFALPFARPVADRLYRWVARNRYRLGCSTHCRRPD